MHLVVSLVRRLVFAMYQYSWTITAMLLVIAYLGGYLFMWLGEERPILDAYFWWFIVSSTTVGYGDLYPTSVYGRAGAIFVMLIGIGVLAIIIGKIAETMVQLIHHRLKGLGKMRDRDHILIIGYKADRTGKIVDELRIHDPRRRIVLCADSLAENPFNPQQIGFVKGNLGSADVLQRSAAKDAAKVIIDGDNDDQTFFIAYAIREINQSAQMVCYLREEEHKGKIRRLPAREAALNQVILPVNMYLMAQELADPESSEVFQELCTNFEGSTLFRLDVPDTAPEGLRFAMVFEGMKQRHDVTVLALKDTQLISNPPLDAPVRPGAVLFYVGRERLDTVDWSAFTAT